MKIQDTRFEEYMNNDKARSAEAIELRKLIESEELQVLTVVRMANDALDKNNLEEAYSRLRVDIDKLDTHPELVRKIRNHFEVN